MQWNKQPMHALSCLSCFTPYITTVDFPERLPARASANASWAAAPIVHRCATTQASHIQLGILTLQEAWIHAAADNTLHEICTHIWLDFFDVKRADEAMSEGEGGEPGAHK
jgi:hypothetical protein